jgi:hypothetical protein
MLHFQDSTDSLASANAMLFLTGAPELLFPWSVPDPMCPRSVLDA